MPAHPLGGKTMRIDKGVMVALGYGKFFRSDNIVGLEPIEENRGPGQRTRVYVQGVDEPLVASRSEHAILRDLTGVPRAESNEQEQSQLLHDILDTISEINPLMRTIIRDQGNWDLDRLEERAREVLGEDVESMASDERSAAASN
jgi:hypothetical protein